MKRDLPERTFAFATRVVRLCRVLDQTPGVSRTLANQLLRAGTSIGANVEEGQASQSKADFIAKYSIACKEARETHYWLRLLTATEILPADRLRPLEKECNELIAILTAIIKNHAPNNFTLQTSPFKLWRPHARLDCIHRTLSAGDSARGTLFGSTRSGDAG